MALSLPLLLRDLRSAGNKAKKATMLCADLIGDAVRQLSTYLEKDTPALAGISCSSSSYRKCKSQASFNVVICQAKKKF